MGATPICEDGADEERQLVAQAASKKNVFLTRSRPMSATRPSSARSDAAPTRQRAQVVKVPLQGAQSTVIAPVSLSSDAPSNLWRLRNVVLLPVPSQHWC